MGGILDKLGDDLGGRKKGEPDEEPKESPFQKEMREYRQELLKTHTAREIVGRGEQPAPKSEEKLGVNLGDIFKAQADMVNAALSRVTEMELRQTASEAPYFRHVEEELRELKGKLEDRQNVDPFQLLAESQTRLEGIAQVLKKHLGIGEGVKVGGSDIRDLMELEDRRHQHEEERNRWQMERDDVHRRWEIEDKKWQAQFTLDLKKFESGEGIKKDALGGLQDILGSLGENIEKARAEESGGGGIAGKVEGQKREPEINAEMVSFPCPICHRTIEIPDGAESVTCPNEECKATYRIKTNA